MTTSGEHPGRFVRPARVDDTGAMAALALAAWRVSFHEVVPMATLTSWEAEPMADAWRQAILEPPTPGHRVLVATDDGIVRGYAALAPASDPDLVGVPGIAEIVDLVVAPNAERQGHGSRLLHACADYARDGGATAALTWVALADEPRRAFLLGHGFGPDGAIRELDLDGTGTTLLKQVRMVTSFEGT
jgi:GNAT superfamily N-acetyltransferase